MKKVFIPLFLFCLFLISMSIVSKSFADDLEDLTKQINELKTSLNMSVNATKPLESQLNSMQTQLANIKQNISIIENDILTKKKHIVTSYAELEKKQKILNQTIRDFYIKSSYNSPILVFLTSSSATHLTEVLAYQKAATDQDKMIITNVALSIADLETKKKNLEEEQGHLTILKASLDEESAKLDKIVSGAKAYQATLTHQIAQLSAKQQQLVAQKLGSLGLPTSAYTMQGGCSSDLTNGKDPGFGNRFGLFTYGVPHRVGMSQYGAKGRADAGQNFQDILHAYFSADITSGYDQGINIHVVGSNEYQQSFDTTWNIEEYVKHIYEIPTSWPQETLKAQAIAARSYALAVTNNGASSICPSQSCQVVKQELNSQAWIDAVNATAGQVLTSGGQPIKAWFSSTAGGYEFSSADVWGNATSWTKNAVDANGSIGSFSDLSSKAYDKDSPWFYCDWGGRSQYGGTAWLKADELADIINVLLLAKADSSTQNHLAQLDKSNPDGVETWDPNRVKQELQNRHIIPFTNISDGSIDADFGSGKTTTVHISGDGGSQTFTGSDFKNYFNLRAPSNINIVGPLYNIEKR